MKMGSTLWKIKHKVKRNPGWLFTPLVLMLFLLVVRVLFAWKSAFSVLSFVFWIGIGVAIGLGISTRKKKGQRRKMALKKWPPRRTIR